jgi:NAD(P)-dependent dehydrogenase (short-subunit alcohol dehydrogenase family)
MSTCLITGASSGIGAAIAEALAEPGRELILTGREREALDVVQRAVRDAGGEASVRLADLRDDAAVRELADALPEALDGVVHSAGVARLGRQESLSVDDLDLQWRINVRAPFVLTQALLPRLRRARGLVVFVNSGAGQRARAAWGGYAASKFALRALADSLRDEEAEHGVRVSSVYPGRVATRMQKDVRRQEGGAYQPEAYLRPEDVARVVADVVRLAPPATVPDVSVRPG